MRVIDFILFSFIDMVREMSEDLNCLLYCKFYIKQKLVLSMNKRGLGLLGIALVVVLIVVIIVGAIFVLRSMGALFEESEEIDSEDTNETGNESQEQEIPENTGNESANATEELFLDIEAISLTLVNAGCDALTNSTTNETYSLCDIDLVGILKNTGTETIEENFVVHFFDTTEGSSLIELFIVRDSIVPGEEKEFSVFYNNVPPGTYIILFRVDAVNTLDESNEGNNDISKVVGVS